MDLPILKELLNKQFYEDNKDKLSHTLFDEDVAELYDIIINAHKRFPTPSLTTDELFALWQADNPTATRANQQAMHDVIGKLGSSTSMSPEVAAVLLDGLWRRKMGRRIANLGIALAEGKDEAFRKLQTLIDDHAQGFLPTDFGEETPKDINLLLNITSDDNLFQFNIPNLSKHVFGIGRAMFGILYARPETGKTALGASLCFAPNGFADQGLKVCMLGNEESTARTMVRAYSCYTGMTKEEIINAPELAQERFDKIKDNVTMMDIMNWDIEQVEAFIQHKEADVVVIDQGDKVQLNGNFDSPHLKLRELYTQLREMAKRQNCALLAVSQASAEAEGKTVVTPDMMENSKTGKYAEVDLAIGVGKYPDDPNGSDDPIRFLTVGKNKISGWHGTIPVKLDKFISRYTN